MAAFEQFNKSGIGIDSYPSYSFFKLLFHEEHWKRAGDEAGGNLYADAGQASAWAG